MPVCAGFAPVLAPNASTASPVPIGILWQPVAVVFGASLGYALVLMRRPRRLRGGTYFLVAGAGWLAATVWAYRIDFQLLLLIAEQISRARSWRTMGLALGSVGCCRGGLRIA